MEFRRHCTTKKESTDLCCDYPDRSFTFKEAFATKKKVYLGKKHCLWRFSNDESDFLSRFKSDFHLIQCNTHFFIMFCIRIRKLQLLILHMHRTFLILKYIKLSFLYKHVVFYISFFN